MQLTGGPCSPFLQKTPSRFAVNNIRCCNIKPLAENTKPPSNNRAHQRRLPRGGRWLSAAWRWLGAPGGTGLMTRRTSLTGTAQRTCRERLGCMWKTYTVHIHTEAQLGGVSERCFGLARAMEPPIDAGGRRGVSSARLIGEHRYCCAYEAPRTRWGPVGATGRTGDEHGNAGTLLKPFYKYVRI